MVMYFPSLHILYSWTTVCLYDHNIFTIPSVVHHCSSAPSACFKLTVLLHISPDKKFISPKHISPNFNYLQFLVAQLLHNSRFYKTIFHISYLFLIIQNRYIFVKFWLYWVILISVISIIGCIFLVMKLTVIISYVILFPLYYSCPPIFMITEICTDRLKVCCIYDYIY